MKFYTNKLALCSAAALGVTLLAACGDTNTTEVTEQTGMNVLAKGEKLPDCTKDNAGDMLYVADSAAVYYCADGEWATLNGKDGEKGTSCTAKTVKDGIEISCDDKVIGTIKNGEPGTATDGKPGANCKIDETAGNGVVKVTCGEGDDEKTVTLYKAMCGTNSYDPAIQYCLDLNGKKKVEALLIDDRDENNVQVYKTVTIKGSYKITDDNQKETTVQYEEIWMAENLNYSVNPGVQSWCGGGEVGTTNEGDCSKYGRLYTWAASVGKSEEECGFSAKCDLSGTVRGACPVGWHLPSKDEWESLMNTVGGLNLAFTRLKSSSGWDNKDDGTSGNGDDSFGFSVLPAGYRDAYKEKNFLRTGFGAYFWLSSENPQPYAYTWFISNLYSEVKHGDDEKPYAYSVRCLKDKATSTDE